MECDLKGDFHFEMQNDVLLKGAQVSQLLRAWPLLRILDLSGMRCASDRGDICIIRDGPSPTRAAPVSLSLPIGHVLGPCARLLGPRNLHFILHTCIRMNMFICYDTKANMRPNSLWRLLARGHVFKRLVHTGWKLLSHTLSSQCRSFDNELHIGWHCMLAQKAVAIGL